MVDTSPELINEQEDIQSPAGNPKDIEALEFFLGLKGNYELQRQPWENRWRQALAAYHLTDDLNKVYEGRAKIQVPIVKWKVNGIVARINKVLFDVAPIARLEDKKIADDEKTVADLWNKYIFEHQIDEIHFKSAFKKFIKNKTIEGTSVAKITQEFEEKEFTFFEDEEDETITVKDNTYFRNMLLTEFYSDVSKENINDSQACIHTSAVSFESLRLQQERTEREEVETEFGVEIQEKQVGVYRNLHLIISEGNNITDEQASYIEFLGLNKGQATEFKRSIKESRKTGFVQIDECYGRFDLDGDGVAEEVICTIANGRVVIRLSPTDFKHKKFVRPFIVGRYEPIANCLYGNSNVITGHSLLMELNASRAQATDAKTRSVANMWYVDETKNVRWDGTWRPNGKIVGQGKNGMEPLINPNLSNVTIQDSETIQRDLDQLWSLSPVQEGTSDSRLIPSTARGTLAIISQNDLPLNDIIDNTIDTEMKPFFEMLFERNLVFKSIEDLLDVWDEKDLQKAGIDEDISMRDLLFEFNIKVLGNLELSNEVAHQQGWQQFINWAMAVPPVASRIDWQALANKQLASFGIKDDSEGIWLDDEVVLETREEKANQEVEQDNQLEQKRQQLRGEAKEDKVFETEVDTEADLVKMQAEAAIEGSTGQKIQ